MNAWWNFETEKISKDLNVDLTKGLSAKEAEDRIEKYGTNQLKEKEKHSALKLFFEQFKDFIVWVLIGASLVSGFLGEWIDACAIIAIVVLNAILGFVQEFRAEKSLAALKKLSSPNSKVIRDGSSVIVPSISLVPGDIIELESGDHVPADSRLFYVSPNFATQEASLTGESCPVAKITKLLPGDIGLADRENMVYMGTSVSSGKARAIIVETGMTTELGKIAGMIQKIEGEDTPLQKKLEEFGKIIVYICIAIVVLVFILGVMRGGKVIDMFMTAVSLAVAAIPEGLAAVVTVALALGVQRMVKRNVLIRKLPAVETLGCASVICSDKTGTLTKNEMTVQEIFTNGKKFKVTGIGYEPKGEIFLEDTSIEILKFPDAYNTLVAGILCNGASLIKKEGAYKIIGDPTEGAILVCAQKVGVIKENLEKDFAFIEEIPFDPTRKKMTILRKNNEGKVMAFVKGAPEIILSDCNITEADKEIILNANKGMANNAMRVLGIACRTFDKHPEKIDESLEKDLTFLGLIAMIDPARDEVKEAMKICKTAAIKTVMITGDNKDTATAIAKELGFFTKDSMALTGKELDGLSEEELQNSLEKIVVYARVSPEHKLRIVSAWRKSGRVVAMTGDGVNDAPAVKEADIGVAMGITGTDVTKEVSDMVITDDNFASIVAAVEEGRGIYDNIKKFIHYLLSCNIGEVLVMFVSSLVGLPLPLLPIHILWVNLVTDGLPALALGMDTVDKNIMKRPPRSVDEKVIPRQQAYIMLAQGAFIAFCSLLAFVFVLYIEKEDLARARTAAFVVLACSQLFHSFNCRSMTESLFSLGIFTNMKLVWAGLISFVLQMAVVYVPFLQKIFKTEPLGLFDWVMVVLVSSFPLWAMEVIKFVRKRKNESIA